MSRLLFRRFRASDLAGLSLQPAQRDAQVIQKPGSQIGEVLEATGMSWSAIAGDTLVACAGIVPVWQGRAAAWALFGEIPRGCWTAITRKVKHEIADAHSAGWWRIEATARSDFAPACRWLEMLGFEIEGLAKAYDLSRRDHILFGHVAYDVPGPLPH